MRADFRAWGVQIRPRDGFGWGEPSLAHAALFAWHESELGILHEPIEMALYPSHAAAQRAALIVRSRKLSAMPVSVRVNVEGGA